MNFSQIIYIPLLHPELAPEKLPPDLLFLAPGLVAEAASGRFASPRLPFAPAQAKAVLREMLDLGSALSQGGPDSLSDGLRRSENAARPAAPSSKHMGREEAASLDNFAENASVNATPARPKTPAAELERAELIRAQKMLLLAWELEENLLDIKKAKAALAGQDEFMFAALHGRNAAEAAGLPGEEKDDAAPYDGLETGLLPAPPPIPWQRFLEAAAPFLPENALLFSAAPEVLAALAELNALQPMPQELQKSLAERPGFAALLPRLRFGQAKLRELVPARKQSGSAPPCPWLDETYNFLLLTGQNHV